MWRRAWEWLNQGPRVRLRWPRIWPGRWSRLVRFAGKWQSLFLALVMLGLLIGLPQSGRIGDGMRDGTTIFRADNQEFLCHWPKVIDGDTIHCGTTRVRLAGIDAPEMPGHCRPGRDCTPGDPYAARDYLRSIVRNPMTCRATDKDAYGRIVARCKADGKDLSCAMLAAGHAVRRYGYINCLF